LGIIFKTTDDLRDQSLIFGRARAVCPIGDVGFDSADGAFIRISDVLFESENFGELVKSGHART